MEKVGQREGDFILLLLTALLVGLGVAVLFSASYYHAEKLGREPSFFFRKQLFFAAIGCVLGFIISRTPLELLRKSVPLMLLGSFILMLLPFIPGIGKTVNNARRWIFLFGQSFQPSEVVKLVMVIYLSSILSKKQDKMDDLTRSVLPPVIMVMLFTVMVYLQNDFSTAFFIAFVSFAIFFVANVRIIHFFLFGITIVPLGIVLLFTKTYWVKKIMAFIKLDSDLAGMGYQVSQARQALVNGGLLGMGLGNGVKKLGGVPEADSDFIFAVIAEEMGLLGALLILGFFIAFAYRGYSISHRCEDDFSGFLAFGITTIILFQVFLNVAVVVGVIPVTGIPLPFFSNGGSAMLINLVMCGILFNISRREKIPGRGF